MQLLQQINNMGLQTMNLKVRIIRSAKRSIENASETTYLLLPK